VITDMLLKFFTDGIRIGLGLLPVVRVPSWAGSGGSAVAAAGSIGSQAGALGAWVDWGAAATVWSAILWAAGIAVVIRAVRMVLSLFTGGGGSVS
jgi:hypothetical protein